MKSLGEIIPSSFPGGARTPLRAGSSRPNRIVILSGREQSRRSARLRSGFTLLEVLLVMTLIVGLLGAAAAALAQHRGGGVTLRSAAETLAMSLASARQQAILHQTRTRWLLAASKPPMGRADSYLCAVQIIREDPAGSGAWILAGDGVVLPRGVGVVPPVVSADQVVGNASWPNGPKAPRSNLSGPIAINVDGIPFAAAYYLEFGPIGQPNPTPAIVCVATARSGAAGVLQFEGPESVRGLRLQTSGALIQLDDAADF